MLDAALQAEGAQQIIENLPDPRVVGFRPAEDLAGALGKALVAYIVAADPAGDDPALAEAFAAGTTLSFTAGIVTLSAGCNVTGTTLNIGSGVLNYNSAGSVARISLAAGTLGGSSPINVTGAVTNSASAVLVCQQQGAVQDCHGSDQHGDPAAQEDA